MLHIQKKFLSLGKKARWGEKFVKSVDRIIIHWIGPFPGQTVMTPWHWWETGSDGTGIAASAHFIIKDKNVLQALPLDEVGFHSGDARNHHSIGIEVVPMNIKGEFSNESIESLREVVQHIYKTYPGIFLERHYDGLQRKDCPRWFTPFEENGEERWTELVEYCTSRCVTKI